MHDCGETLYGTCSPNFLYLLLQDNGTAYNRPSVDDFLSEDAQFV